MPAHHGLAVRLVVVSRYRDTGERRESDGSRPAFAARLDMDVLKRGMIAPIVERTRMCRNSADEILLRTGVLRGNERKADRERNRVTQPDVDFRDHGLCVRRAIRVLVALHVVMPEDVVVLICQRDGAFALRRHPRLRAEWRN